MAASDAIAIRGALLLKLRARDGSNPLPPKSLPGLEAQAAQLQAFVDSVGTASGNNSLLVVGRNGSGRRSTIRLALSRVRGKKVVLWLDGSVLSDDAKALREISRQLAVDTSGAGLAGFVYGSDSDDADESGGDDFASAAAPDDEGSVTGATGSSAEARLRRSILARCPALTAAAHSAARAASRSMSAPTPSVAAARAVASAVSSAGDVLPASALVLDTAPSVAAAAASAAPQAASLLSQALDIAVAIFPRHTRVWAPGAAAHDGGGGAAAEAQGAAAGWGSLGTAASAAGPRGQQGKKRRREVAGDAGAEGVASAVQAPLAHRPVQHEGRQVRATP